MCLLIRALELHILFEISVKKRAAGAASGTASRSPTPLLKRAKPIDLDSRVVGVLRRPQRRKHLHLLQYWRQGFCRPLYLQCAPEWCWHARASGEGPDTELCGRRMVHPGMELDVRLRDVKDHKNAVGL